MSVLFYSMCLIKTVRTDCGHILWEREEEKTKSSSTRRRHSWDQFHNEEKSDAIRCTIYGACTDVSENLREIVATLLFVEKRDKNARHLDVSRTHSFKARASLSILSTRQSLPASPLSAFTRDAIDRVMRAILILNYVALWVARYPS